MPIKTIIKKKHITKDDCLKKLNVMEESDRTIETGETTELEAQEEDAMN